VLISRVERRTEEVGCLVGSIHWTHQLSIKELRIPSSLYREEALLKSIYREIGGKRKKEEKKEY